MGCGFLGLGQLAIEGDAIMFEVGDKIRDKITRKDGLVVEIELLHDGDRAYWVALEGLENLHLRFEHDLEER